MLRWRAMSVHPASAVAALDGSAAFIGAVIAFFFKFSALSMMATRFGDKGAKLASAAETPQFFAALIGWLVVERNCRPPAHRADEPDALAR